MAIHRGQRGKPLLKPRSPTFITVTATVAGIGLLLLASSFFSINGFSFSSSSSSSSSSKSFQNSYHHKGPETYLYWGDRIDCPGKHCDSCEGLGHQESSLRCALEEALYLNR